MIIRTAYHTSWKIKQSTIIRKVLIFSNFPEALASFDKAIAINPYDAYTWNFRGVALHELRRYAEAVDSYDRAIALNPKYAEVKLNRKLALKKQS